MKLNIKLKKAELYGLSKFNGIDIIRLNNVYDTSLPSKFIVNWNMYLDKDTSYYNEGMSFSSNAFAGTSVMLINSSIYITGYSNFCTHYSIKNLDHKILNCEILRDPSYNIFYIKEFKINNIVMDGCIYQIASGNAQVQQAVGSGYYFKINDFSTNNLAKLNDAAIWDLKLMDANTREIVHYYKGYPNGDTSISWRDTVSLQYPAIFNIDETRDASYGPILNAISSNSNKLIFNSSNVNKLILTKSIYEILGDEKIADWGNNTSPYNYETFSTSGKDIISAINTTGEGKCNTGTSIPVTGGHRYKAVINITLNSGTAPTFWFDGSPNSAESHILSAGENIIYYQPAFDSLDCVLWLNMDNNIATNYSAVCSLKEVL